MTTAQNDNTVQVHYTGKLDDGTVFDSSQERAPLEFTVGAGQVIPGFDNAVRGMSVGETKTVRIPVDEAYGPRHQEAVLKVDRTQFPADFDPQQGQVVGLKNDKDQELRAIIVEVTSAYIVMDANHPLAGFALNFELELVSIS